MTKEKVKRLKTKLDHNSGISQRTLAKIFDVHQSTIYRTIKQKTSIRYREKIKAPKRTPQQTAVARSKCYQLANLFRKKVVVIDDESYFRLSNCDLSGNAGFYLSNVDTMPNEVKLKSVAKF